MIEVGREEGHEYLDLSRSTFDSTRLDSKAESKSQRGEKWVTDRDPRSSRCTRTDVSPILRHACTLFHRLVVSYRLYRTHAIRSAAQKKTHLHLRLFLHCPLKDPITPSNEYGLPYNYAQSRDRLPILRLSVKKKKKKSGKVFPCANLKMIDDFSP